MGCLSSLTLPFVFVFLVVLVSPSHGISSGTQQQNDTTVQIALGEDVYFPCHAPADTVIYVWQKNGRNVEADRAYSENRVYVIEHEGILILNTEARDSGSFTCTAFDRTLVVLTFRLEVVARTEDPQNTGDAFQCGYPRQRSRIVGGREVNDPGAYPWMALLWHKVERRPFCGGALLSRRFVVTAAHCFLQSGHNPNDVEVRLGEHNITATESYEVTMQIAEMIPHPNYDQPTYDSDILLLRLQQPVVYSDYIIPICIPSELRGERLIQPGKRGYAAGWGRTEHSETAADFSDVLRRARLSITDHQRCGEQHTHVITNNMFCAIGGNRRNGVRDSCSGDSGGPFIVKEEERNYLVGIVSWGIGCANINFPGVYTRVGRFRHWILEHINNDLQTCEETSFQTEEDLSQEQSRIQSLEDQVSNLQEQLEILQSRDIPVCTTPPATTTVASTAAPSDGEPIPCRRGSCWHVGGYRIWGQCVNGFCVCNSPYYSRVTCLPSVGTCKIRENDPTNSATPMSSRSGEPTVYSCEGNQGSTADVHVLGVYEGNVHTRPPTAGTMNVIVTASPALTRPVILVFSNYEPVNWVLDLPATLNVQKVILFAYYGDLSSVTVAPGVSQTLTVEKRPRSAPRGYGKDSGGGNTAGMLRQLSEDYGAVTSFAGTYRADSWSWPLPLGISTGGTGTEEVTSSVEVTTDAWTEYDFRYQNNWNSCHSAKYVRKRPVSDDAVGKYVGAVLCTNNRYKLFLSDSLDSEFLNIADTSGHGSDHCEFVGASSSGDFNLDNNFWHSPSATGYYRSGWGDDMQLGTIGGGMGPAWTGRYYPKWYECGVSIP